MCVIYKCSERCELITNIDLVQEKERRKEIRFITLVDVARVPFLAAYQKYERVFDTHLTRLDLVGK